MLIVLFLSVKTFSSDHVNKRVLRTDSDKENQLVRKRQSIDVEEVTKNNDILAYFGEPTYRNNDVSTRCHFIVIMY